jgi:Glycosyl transferases group 1
MLSAALALPQRRAEHPSPLLAFALAVLLLLALQFGPMVGLLGLRITGAERWTLVGLARDVLVAALVLCGLRAALAGQRRWPASMRWALAIVLVDLLFALLSSSVLFVLAFNLRRLVLVPLLFMALWCIPWTPQQLRALLGLLFTSSVLVALLGLAERALPVSLWTTVLEIDRYNAANALDRFGAIAFEDSGRFYSWDLEPWLHGPLRRMVSTYLEPTTLAAAMATALVLALAQGARGRPAAGATLLFTVCGVLTLSKGFVLFLPALLAWRLLGLPSPRQALLCSLLLVAAAWGLSRLGYGAGAAALHVDGLSGRWSPRRRRPGRGRQLHRKRQRDRRRERPGQRHRATWRGGAAAAVLGRRAGPRSDGHCGGAARPGRAVAGGLAAVLADLVPAVGQQPGRGRQRTGLHGPGAVPPPGLGPAGTMKLALLTTRLFDAPRSGGELCTARLAAALREGQHELLRIGRGPLAAGAGELSLGPLVPAFNELPWARRLASVGAALAAGAPITVHRLAAGGAARRLASAIEGHFGEGLDGMVVDHLQTQTWLHGCTRALPRLLVMHNLESDGYLHQARRVRLDGPAALLRRFVLRRESQGLRRLEVQALAQATAVACLSEDDALRLRALRPGGTNVPIEVLPGFPSAGPLPPPPPAADGRRRIGLIGTWTWGPNRDALRWMVEQVLPRLPPHCRLLVAGTGLDTMALPPRVHKLGRVASAAQFHAEVDLLAVPSLHGSGVQEKAIEAIGTGRPVVASVHALRGLGPLLPPQVHAASDADGFAQLCAQVPLGPDGFVDGRAPAHEALVRWVASRQALYAAALARCLCALRDAGRSTALSPRAWTAVRELQ